MKRVCSIFSQILQMIPRDRFEAAVEKHQAERHARGLSSWGQFFSPRPSSDRSPACCIGAAPQLDRACRLSQSQACIRSRRRPLRCV